MIPIWNFLITRVKSENTVKNIRKNITVHGDSGALVKMGKEEGRSKGGRRKEKLGESSTAAEVREAALQEREAAEKEVEKLRNIVKRQKKDLKARMLEVSRAEAERKRMLDERSKKRYAFCIIVTSFWVELKIHFVVFSNNYVRFGFDLIADDHPVPNELNYMECLRVVPDINSTNTVIVMMIKRLIKKDWLLKH